MAVSPMISQEDADLFYEIWFSLLAFANRKYKIDKSGTIYQRGEGILVENATKVSDYIWSHTSCIDEFVKQTKMSKEKKEIALSWKKRVSGTFVVERNLKRGSVLISKENEVYLVKGLMSTFDEMFPVLPVALETTLLPFKDTIVTCGLFQQYPIQFGPGFCRSIKETYMTAKENGTIKTTL